MVGGRLVADFPRGIEVEAYVHCGNGREQANVETEKRRGLNGVCDGCKSRGW